MLTKTDSHIVSLKMLYKVDLWYQFKGIGRLWAFYHHLSGQIKIFLQAPEPDVRLCSPLDACHEITCCVYHHLPWPPFRSTTWWQNAHIQTILKPFVYTCACIHLKLEVLYHSKRLKTHERAVESNQTSACIAPFERVYQGICDLE